MGEPRADKVAVVAEVKRKLDTSDGVVLTEYRGLNVPAMAGLRRSLAPVGGDYKIYKNTLIKLAANELGMELDELLVGPTALAFVGEKPDGSASDAAAVAKALRDYGKTNTALVIKGGVLDGKALTVDEIQALADLPSREVLFAEFAGAMEYMLGEFAGGLDAKLREFVYAMQELIDKGGPGGSGSGEASAAEDVAAPAAVAAEDAAADDAVPAAVAEDAVAEEEDDGDAPAEDSAPEAAVAEEEE